MRLLFTFLQPIYNDAPEPWQIGFQDGASPGFEGITELHDSIFFFLVVISVGVFWALGSVMINFNSTSSPIVYKYSNHGFKIIVTIFFILLLLSWHNPIASCVASLSLVPVKPGDDKPMSRYLTKSEKEAFSVTPELKAHFNWPSFGRP